MELTKQNFLDKFIEYCETTATDEWCLNVVRSKDSKANCLFGHIFKFVDDDKALGNEFWDFFESRYATTYMVFPVNDKAHPDYQQETARDRCIAYLKDLRDGKTKTVLDYLIEDEARYKSGISPVVARAVDKFNAEFKRLTKDNTD